MSWLEIIGFIAIWVIGTLIVCLVAVYFGERHGRSQGMAGLVYVVYPPIVVISFSAVIGVFILGRITV